MVRLNKTQLSNKQLHTLYDQLDNTLGKLSMDQTSHFLSELLGHEERIMLAKRLAIIVLLIEGKSLYKISKLLKVSSATCERVQNDLEHGRYNYIVQTLGKSKKNYHEILMALDNILHLGGLLPHYNGPSRYKAVKKYY